MEKKRTPGRQRSIRIEGEDVAVTYAELPFDQVQLDPNNPRFKYQLSKQTPGKPTQDAIKTFLLNLPGVRQHLFLSIRDHGGLMDPIVVTAKGHVAEGNCRAAVYLDLNSRQPEDKRWKTIPAYVLPHEVTSRQIAILQAEEHISGKIMWRTYEKAGHVHHMKTDLRMSEEAIAKALGTQPRVINRLLEAHETMTRHYLPKVEGTSGLKAWSYFEEFHKIKELSEFRKDEENRKKFAQWVSDGKFPKGASVRELPSILRNPTARAKLETEGYKAAIKEVRKEDPTKGSELFRQVRRTTEMLNKVKTPMIQQVRQSGADQQELRNLYGALKKLADAVDLKLS